MWIILISSSVDILNQHAGLGELRDMTGTYPKFYSEYKPIYWYP